MNLAKLHRKPSALRIGDLSSVPTARLIARLIFNAFRESWIEVESQIANIWMARPSLPS